jgi:hypothetical protein
VGGVLTFPLHDINTIHILLIPQGGLRSDLEHAGSWEVASDS